MDRVTETALANPEVNATFVADARRVARAEIKLLMLCLDELSPSDDEYTAIQREIARIETLPGMKS